jgi:DNA-binding IclR family transcriptional regulator
MKERKHSVAQAKPIMAGARRDADLEGSDPLIATTLARGLRVLRAFHAQDEEFLGNKELAERTGLPKSTVSRLAYTLAKLGYLSRHPRIGTYALAAGVLAPAYAFLSRFDIRRLAQPYMRKMAVQPGVTLSLATRHELRMTTIESVSADAPVPQVGLFGGRAAIARTAIGHAYLAGLPDHGRAVLMKELSSHYQAQWSEIEKRIFRDIASVRRKGYCTVRGEWDQKISGVACPIVIREGELVLSMSAGGPSQLLTSSLLEQLGASLHEACAEIEIAAGASRDDMHGIVSAGAPHLPSRGPRPR